MQNSKVLFFCGLVLFSILHNNDNNDNDHKQTQISLEAKCLFGENNLKITAVLVQILT